MKMELSSQPGSRPNRKHVNLIFLLDAVEKLGESHSVGTVVRRHVNICKVCKTVNRTYQENDIVIVVSRQ